MLAEKGAEGMLMAATSQVLVMGTGTVRSLERIMVVQLKTLAFLLQMGTTILE